MKKIVFHIFVLILALFVLCGCENTVPPELPWEYNLEEHWKTDENGEKIDFSEHQLDSNLVCSVCKSRIFKWDDGSSTIHKYDENGNTVSSKTYRNGEVISESEYAIGSNGNSFPARSVFFNDNGEKIDLKSNEFDQVVEGVCYSADGEILYEEYFEYTFSEDGTYYLSFEKYCDHKEIRIFENTYNESGDWLSYAVYRLDTGSLIFEETYEYEYDGEGRKIYKKALKNGELTEEFFYDFYEDGEDIQTYCSKYIHYIRDQHVNGHYTVTEYDKYGNTISESSYDSLGNKIS